MFDGIVIPYHAMLLIVTNKAIISNNKKYIKIIFKIQRRPAYAEDTLTGMLHYGKYCLTSGKVR